MASWHLSSQEICDLLNKTLSDDDDTSDIEDASTAESDSNSMSEMSPNEDDFDNHQNLQNDNVITYMMHDKYK